MMIPPKILPVSKLKIPMRKGYKPNKVGVCHVHQLANGTYQITRKTSRRKNIMGITKYYYSSKSLDNVLIVLQYLLTHDWEMPRELPPPPKWNGGKPRNRSRYTAIRYIQQLPTGKYILQRRGVHYGTFNTIIDAVKEKLFLESIDWDYSNMETVESLEYQENKETWRRAINE